MVFYKNENILKVFTVYYLVFTDWVRRVNEFLNNNYNNNYNIIAVMECIIPSL